MSLNGLDSAAVQEAYQGANTEAGGWLLLKYASRDSIELLGRGKGGVQDARAAVIVYEEKSPLYGVIFYRRRKVLIKYVPEGTSRVILARTAVHWQDVLEKFAPCETVLEIKNAEELNDTSLAASFPLHTASPSVSSSRLHEISEDAEDTSGLQPRPSITSDVSTSYRSGRRRGEKRAAERALNSDRSPPPTIQVEEVATRQPTGMPQAAPPKKAHISQFLVKDDAGKRTVTSLSPASSAPLSQFSSSASAAKSADKVAEPPDPAPTTASSSPQAPGSSVSTVERAVTPSTFSDAPEGKKSFESDARSKQLPNLPAANASAPSEVERPPTTQPASTQLDNGTSNAQNFDDDPYNYARFFPKPKVRLAPRPVAPDQAKRPSVAGVASIPASYRMSQQKKPDSVRPKSTGPMNVPMLSKPDNLPAPPPIPNIPEYTPRPVSRGSIKSLPSHKSTAMTPDKIRLMKAVELRKKQLRKSNPQPNFVPPPEDDAPSVPKVPEVAPVEESKSEVAEKPLTRDEQRVEQQIAAKKADSGISMQYEDRNQKEAEQQALSEAPQEDSHTDVTASEQPEQITTAPASAEPTADPFEPTLQSAKLDISGADDEQKTDAEPAAAEVNQSMEDQPRPEVVERDVEQAADDTTAGASVDQPPAEAKEGISASNIPTIRMADGSRPLSSIGAPQLAPATRSEQEPKPRGEDDGVDSSGDELSPRDQQVRRKDSDLAKRRRGFVEPLHLDPDGEYSSDDEFMQELQNATVHQARPLTVSKSPVQAYFPRRPSNTSLLSEPSRQSTPHAKEPPAALDFAEMQDRLSPANDFDPYNYTSVSPVVTPPLEQGDPMARRNVSDGISRRIQALTEKTSREGINSPERSLSPEDAHYFDRRDSRRGVPSGVRRASSIRAMHRQSARMSSYQTQAAATTSPQFRSTLTVQPASGPTRNSVSVTARIVRPATQTATAVDESELQQPELVVNTQAPNLPKLDTNPQVPPARSESTASGAISPETTRSPTSERQPHSTRRFGRHRHSNSVASPNLEDFPPPPTTNAEEAPKESTMTSRFFKRMSNIASKRKTTHSIASSNSQASERGSIVASNTISDKPDPPPATLVGDLNVQFPDSLLWKRRIVTLTDTGDLVFTAPQSSNQKHSVPVRKFPLQSFKYPYVPDLERQELPHSVVLEFAGEGEGGTLQVACEDQGSGRRVAGVLRSYWRAWN